jgi:hypothetical protein
MILSLACGGGIHYKAGATALMGPFSMKRTTKYNYIDLTQYCTGRINRKRKTPGRMLVLCPAIGLVIWIILVLAVYLATRNPSI